MDRLRVDTHFLRETGAQLRAIATEFHSADANSEYVAEAVGHPKLAAAIRRFADSWDDTRKEMLANMVTLSQAATGVGETFERVDAEFAAALRGQGR